MLQQFCSTSMGYEPELHVGMTGGGHSVGQLHSNCLQHPLSPMIVISSGHGQVIGGQAGQEVVTLGAKDDVTTGPDVEGGSVGKEGGVELGTLLGELLGGSELGAVLGAVLVGGELLGNELLGLAVV